MRILKPALAAVAAAIIAILALWQAGIINFDGASEGESRAHIVASPDDRRLIAALRIVAETQRIREVTGDAQMGARMAAMADAAKAMASGVTGERMEALRAERAAAAELLFALTRAAIEAPQWPPGDAASHEALARALLLESETAYAEAVVRESGVAEALEHAASALFLARGIAGAPPAFMLLASDVADAIHALPDPQLRQPERGDTPAPPTALTVPMGN